MTQRLFTAPHKGKANLKTAAIVFLYGFLLIKPFYIFGEGTFQIGDLCCMLSFICMFAYYGTSFEIEKRDLLFAYFVAGVFVVNSIYWAIYGINTFFVYSLYYFYILLGILLFRKVLPDPRILKNIAIVLRIGLVIQVVLFVLGVGQWIYSDRYGGTFPDPNRFAGYVFFSFLLIKGISILLHQKNHVIDDIMTLFLIWLSASIGMLVGIGIYYICIIIKAIVEGRGTKHLMKTVFIVLGCVAVFALMYANWDFVYSVVNQFPLGKRLLSKVMGFMSASSVVDTSLNSFWEDRAIERIFTNPEYFIFGSGEGYHERFSFLVHEMHSTPLALAYYYGIIPFVFVVAWTVKSCKGTFKNGTWVVLLPLLLESCTLAHQRLLLFWMMIMIAGLTITQEQINELQAETSSIGLLNRWKRKLQGLEPVPLDEKTRPVSTFQKRRESNAWQLPTDQGRAQHRPRTISRK